MSLVGNLEDLSLGDILQIISLSQKSGVLTLEGASGSGRIVFRSGLVHAACLKAQPGDLRSLVIAEGLLDPAGFDAVAARAEGAGLSLDALLEAEVGLTAEQLDTMATTAAEAAILEMFRWPAGDFSFDVRTQALPEDPPILIRGGINAQYLAMEGLRLRDESVRDEGDPETPATDVGVGLEQDPLFGSEPLETDPLEEGDFLGTGDSSPQATEVLVGRVVERLDDEGDLTLDAVEAALTLDTADTPDAPGLALPPARPTAPASGPRTPSAPAPATASEPTAQEAPSVEAPRPAPPASTTPSLVLDDREGLPVEAARRLPVVVIDPDVVALDWIKSTLDRDFARVHVFQQADAGLARIRQYLIRGESPLVLISPETPIDPLSGIRGLGDFVKRLKSQAPRLLVLGLRDDEDAPPSTMPASLDGVLRRPARRTLTERGGDDHAAAGQILSRALLEMIAEQSGERSGPSAPAESLRDLREATVRLQEASSRGEVLPVVLDFAADLFARVAILVVRQDDVFAVAGRGVRPLEVDPLGETPAITIPSAAPGWVRRVIEGGQPVAGPPVTEADLHLLDALGDIMPRESYLAPIESSEQVIAMVYGDRGENDAPLPDTQALEVVLHHAGLALDRAALERALWEVDAAGH